MPRADGPRSASRRGGRSRASRARTGTSRAGLPRLQDLQRWFQAQIVVPHERGAAAARRLRPAAAAVVLPSASLAPDERVAIYSRMVLTRLHEALAEDFAAVAAVLGRPAFARLVKAYLARHPSRHPSLTMLGRSLPRFLAAGAAGPGAEPRIPRRALAADLARLELAMIEVFHAPECRALTGEQLAGVPLAAWPAARLRPIPAFAVLELAHDGNAVVTAVRERRPLPPLRRRRSYVLVWRRGDVVWRQDVDAPRFALLDALARGRTVRRALAAAAAAFPGDPADLTPRVFEWFERWTAEGLFASVEARAARARPTRAARGRRAAARKRQPAARRA